MDAKQRLITNQESTDLVIDSGGGINNNSSYNNSNDAIGNGVTSSSSSTHYRNLSNNTSDNNKSAISRTYIPAPTGLRLFWNRFVQFILFCCFASSVYVIYIHSIYLNLLNTRNYVEAEGSLVNYTRDEFDYSYPTVYKVWINLHSKHLTHNEIKLLKQGQMINLNPELKCSSLQNSHSPILSISLNFIEINNRSNHSHGGGNGTVNGTEYYDYYYDYYNKESNSMSSNYYRKDGSSAYYSIKNKQYLEDYSQYEHYFYNSDYKEILDKYYSMNDNDTDLNGTNATIGNNTNNHKHKNHTINYAENIVYTRHKYWGFLILGMIVNCAFLIGMDGYIIHLKGSDDIIRKKAFDIIWEYQIVIKKIYFPKCKVNKLCGSFLITIIGITTPLYFIASIMPIVAYNYNNNSDDLCLTINNNLGLNEEWLENIFVFMFYWWVICAGIYTLSYCLPEDYKRESCQKNTLILSSVFMIASLAIGIRIAITMELEILYAYGFVGAAYVIAFLLQLSMF